MADTKISNLAAVTDVQDTDEFVLARAGTSNKIDGVDLRSELGGGGWTLMVDKNGSTTSGFTTDSGSWSSDGSIISVDATGVHSRLSCDTVQTSGMYVAQVDMRVKSSGILNNAVAGLLSTWAGTGNNGPSYHFYYQSAGNERVRYENDAVAGSTAVDFAWVPDTWYQLRSFVVREVSHGYVDGVWKLQGTTSQQWPGTGSKLGFTVNLCKADFRNLKLWEPTLPA